MGDEPKARLPTFEEYSRGPKKRLARPKEKQSAPTLWVNDKNEFDTKSFQADAEKIIFRVTWGGIILLVLIEIFVLTGLATKLNNFSSGFVDILKGLIPDLSVFNVGR